MAASDPASAAKMLRAFSGTDLTSTLSSIESSVKGLTAADSSDFLLKSGAGKEVLAAAAEMKRLAGQINVAIHALGILLCLPHILKPGEHVEYVSLGAGNTGREFDLETNLRIAEFKFIHWQGGPESIRQNSLFKDFLLLEGSESPKRKRLYVLGTKYPLKFLNSGRSLASVLSRHTALQALFQSRFGDRFSKVRDYYHPHRDKVLIEDVSQWLPELVNDEIASVVGEEEF